MKKVHIDEAIISINQFIEDGDMDDIASIYSRYCDDGEIKIWIDRNQGTRDDGDYVSSDTFKDGERIMESIKTRQIEYYRLWRSDKSIAPLFWDTQFIDIPADTPDDEIDDAVQEAAERLFKDHCGVRKPVIVGVYSIPPMEDVQNYEN